MVQRMGRTGRKKQGHVVVLVTEGKEQQILKDCLMHKSNIAIHVLSSKELAKGLNTTSPRLVPSEIEPKCDKIYITVKNPPLTKNSSLKVRTFVVNICIFQMNFRICFEILPIDIPNFDSLPIYKL